MRMRLSASPNAPALVATGSESRPSVRPRETPGSISSTRRMPSTPKRASSAAAVSPPGRRQGRRCAPRPASSASASACGPAAGRAPCRARRRSAISTRTSPPASSRVGDAAERRRARPCRGRPAASPARPAMGDAVAAPQACARPRAMAAASEPTTISAAARARRDADRLGALAGAAAASAWARPALPMKNGGRRRGQARLRDAVRDRRRSRHRRRRRRRPGGGDPREAVGERRPPRTVASGTVCAAMPGRAEHVAEVGARRRCGRAARPPPPRAGGRRPGSGPPRSSGRSPGRPGRRSRRPVPDRAVRTRHRGGASRRRAGRAASNRSS